MKSNKKDEEINDQDLFDAMEKFPIWKDNYSKMGVTPRELYMRQNGLCWLKPELDFEDNVNIYCTDGKDKAETRKMLNPTIECVRCMMNFTTKVMQEKMDGKKKDQ